MKYHVLTLFPDMINNGLDTSIMKRARNNNLIKLNTINIRDYAGNKHKQVDDYPYGGGAGMVLQPDPIYSAFRSIDFINSNTKVIYLSPQGKTFDQKLAKQLSTEKEIVFLCGHYEGVDERIIDTIVTDEVSIGDFVLTGGELAAMVIIDAISRLIPGVLNNDISTETESFTDGLLEYPQYTRPQEFIGKGIPNVLLSGHHKNIEVWRRQQSLLRTFNKRPDLLVTADLSEEDKEFIKKYCK